jgi:uncharacterized membrane protein YdjX (TVP38/TMEM64 family)
MQLQQKSLSRKLSVALGFVAIVLLIGHELELYLPALEIWVQDMGVLAPLGFILLFVVLAPFFVSVDALCFAAGVLFSITTGELTIIIATYLAALIIFYLGRDLMREKALTFIAKDKRFAALNKVISGDNSFKLMLLLRLTPFPFAMLSYALSVTQVKFWPYLANHRYFNLQRHAGLFRLYHQASIRFNQGIRSDWLRFTSYARIRFDFIDCATGLCGKNCWQYTKGIEFGKPRRLTFVRIRITLYLGKFTLSLSKRFAYFAVSTTINVVNIKN